MATKNLRHRRASVKKTTPPKSTGIDKAFAKTLCRDLELIHGVVVTVAIALESERADHDLDFAVVLRRCAADPIWGIIEERLGGPEEIMDHKAGDAA
ncbi:MAG: hypothetical protein ACJ8R9_02495 [Steroidobacteraceae bacterium]